LQVQVLPDAPYFCEFIEVLAQRRGFLKGFRWALCWLFFLHGAGCFDSLREVAVVVAKTRNSHRKKYLMHLEMRFEANGDPRPIWYGRFMAHGKRHCVNLGIKLFGVPPASRRLRDQGDAEFERSRGMAEVKLAEVAEEARSARDSARLVERLYAIKTGAKVRTVKLAELESEWASLPRKREVAGRYAAEGQKILGRFVEFVRSKNRKAEELAYVSPDVAAAFMREEKERGVSGRTWNATLKLLRSAFRRLLPSGGPNPFDRLVSREEATVFRQPFSAAELHAILEAAKSDGFIAPIIITGMCTAMRRGDCCMLQWKDVDLRGGFVTVKTAKTGGTVSIPIFGLLRDELMKQAERRKRDGDGAAFVFPKQAAMYGVNPDGITRRVKRVLWAALAGDAEGGMKNADPKLPELPAAEVRERGEAYLAKLGAGERRERMARVFRLYLDGKSVGAVASGAGVSKGSVSEYLNEIETAVKCKLLRWRAGGGVAKAVKEDDSVLRVERTHGVRRASVRDFHSLRVTWVTLALTAGVPLELVQRVTGHKTTDVVLKHYFRPGQEDFRLALEGAMPKLLTVGSEKLKSEKLKAEIEIGGQPVGRTAKEEMRELIATVRPVALRERMFKVWAKL